MSLTKLCFLLAASCLLVVPVWSQDVNLGTVKDDFKKRLKGKPFEIKGTVALNAIYTEGSQPINQPFTYVAAGNVVCKVYGYDLPFSYTYSNKKFSYTNPNFRFNRTSFNPKYKNWVGHFGDVNSNFSPYTLSGGVTIRGVGFEYAPDKWRIEAVGGRMFKAVGEDVGESIKPTFLRYGAGVKTTYNNKNGRISFAALYVKDARHSIPIPQKEANRAIRPMENIAFTGGVSLPLNSKITWDVETSTSVLSQNLLDNERITTSKYQTERWAARLLPQRNSSTKVYHAVKTALNYTIEKTGQIGIAYERVDPQYRTLGGLFFTNDFENLTVNSQYRGETITLNFNTGLQRDDIADRKRNSTGRMVIAVTMNGKISERLDLNMSYNNFQSYAFVTTGFERINKLTPFDNIDTLNYTQLSQNATLSSNYTLQQSEDRIQTIGLNMNFIESANERNQVRNTNQASQLVNGNVIYNLNLTAKNLTIAVGLNGAVNLNNNQKNITWGPNVAVAKPFWDKKASANANLSYNSTKAETGKIAVWTLGVGSNMTFKKKHIANLSILGQFRNNTATPDEMTGVLNLGYTYNF